MSKKKIILIGVLVFLFLVAVVFWLGSFIVKEVPFVATIIPISTTPDPKMYQYIEVTDSCDWQFIGTCVRMRSGPGTQYSVVLHLRTGVVLKVESIVQGDGQTWYKISTNEDIAYPERIKSGWYVAASNVKLFTDVGDLETTAGINASSSKQIVVDLSQELLYAYDGNNLFMVEPISTGLELTPTITGTFYIFKKTPSRYMQGPTPGSTQLFDLPGVPWDLYFTISGDVIHGAYWHDKFGQPWSHGCVNLPPDQAKELYAWADLGTPVTVQN